MRRRGRRRAVSTVLAVLVHAYRMLYATAPPCQHTNRVRGTTFALGFGHAVPLDLTCTDEATGGLTMPIAQVGELPEPDRDLTDVTMHRVKQK